MSAGSLLEASGTAAADFAALAEARLGREPPRIGDPTSNPRGDHDLDPDPAAVVPPRPHRKAAVLVPVIARADGLAVLLTQRAAHLRDHSGQVAFPGGKIEPSDPGPAEAALREAREEIGLAPEAVRLLGYADPYLSATGFLVVPVVGLVAADAVLEPNPAEVAALFEVPLPLLMERGRFVLDAMVWQGRARHYYMTRHAGRTIWGVTAGILVNLRERLFD